MNKLTENSHTSPAVSEHDFSLMDDSHNRCNAALIDKLILAQGAQNPNALTSLERQRVLGTTHERVTGPFDGYFIASYGCCVGELGDEYIGSFKICETRPLSYWKADAKFIGWCSHTEPTGLAALELAEATAQERIPHTFSSPAQQPSKGAATDIFPPSYWARRARRRADLSIGG